MGLENTLQWYKELSAKVWVLHGLLFMAGAGCIWFYGGGLLWQSVYGVLLLAGIPGATYFMQASLRRARSKVIDPEADIHISVRNLVKIYDWPGRVSRQWKSGLLIRRRLGLEKSYLIPAGQPDGYPVFIELGWQFALLGFGVWFTWFFVGNRLWVFLLSFVVYAATLYLWRKVREYLYVRFEGSRVVKYANRWVFRLLAILPQLLVHIVLLVLIGVLVVDVLASYLLVTGKSRHPEKWLEANNKIDRFRIRLGNKIAGSIEKRMTKAYPKASFVEKVTKDKTVFAKGCDFYKIVMLFFVGAFLGDITETIFCRITAGVWMSRSSVVWGPFSIVWGLAIAMVTAMLYKYKDRSDGFLFWTGTFLGGAYEYLCSVFTELVFGKVFWDYSWMPFNLGGRINLLYCVFSGESQPLCGLRFCIRKFQDG